MPFGVGFKSPFDAHVNGDDRRRADAVTDHAGAAKLEHEAGMEHAQGRGSLGDLVGAGKSIGETLNANLGGTSAVSHINPVAGAYNDSTPHTGRDPTTG